jgi:uncharacterized protein YjiS (DUF1127 family)
MAASRRATLRIAGKRPYCSAQIRETLARRFDQKEADMAARFLNATDRAADERLIPQLLAAAGRAWQRHRTYRENQAQLRRLSIREREDVGLAGADVDAVAREAVYRR